MNKALGIPEDATDREIVSAVLDQFGPLSDYGIYHVARGCGFKMTPSSARSRRAELTRARQVKAVGFEVSQTSKRRSLAQVWAVA